MGDDEGGHRRRGRGRAKDQGDDEAGPLPPVSDPAAEGRRRRDRAVRPGDDVANADDPPADGGRRGRKKVAIEEAAADRAASSERPEGKDNSPPRESFKSIMKTATAAPGQGACALVAIEDQELWDLVIVIDVETEDEDEAKKEVDCLLGLLRHEGLQITRRELLDESEGACGRVLCLCTATQAELEQEAEIMAISKSLKIPPEVAKHFQKTETYGRVTAPFTRARRGDFHESPFVDDDDCMVATGHGSEHDRSGLTYFSPCERQALLEHIIESKIREAVHHKMVSQATHVQFFPLHDDDGDGNRDVTWLRENWVTLFRKERWMSLLRFWGNPSKGLEEPLGVLREYFGDQITMYFAFLSFYTKWLSFPAVVGLAFQIWLWIDRGFDLVDAVAAGGGIMNSSKYNESGGLANTTILDRIEIVTSLQSGSDWGLVVYCIFICVWSALFIKYWERRQSALAYYWFTSELSLEAKIRREFYIALDNIDNAPPNFHRITAEEAASMASGNVDGFTDLQKEPTDLTVSNVRKINKKTGQLEEKFPRALRITIYAASVSSITILLCCVGIIFVYFYLINVISAFVDCETGQLAGSIVHSLLIIITSTVYRSLAIKLNDWENHRTDVKYENALIFKVFVFEFVNNFLAMFWIAFLAPYFCGDMVNLEANLAQVAPENSCKAQAMGYSEVTCGEEARKQLLGQLQTKIGTLIITRMIVSNLIEVGGPALKSWMAQRGQSKGKTFEEDSEAAGTSVNGHSFGHAEEGCGEVRVWVHGSGFGFRGTNKGKEDEEEGTGDNGQKAAEKEDGGGTETVGGDEDRQETTQKVWFWGGKRDKKQAETSPRPIKKEEEEAGVRPKDSSSNNSSPQSKRKGMIKKAASTRGSKKRMTNERREHSIRIMKECKPRSREWWMCKGRSEEALEVYGDGGDACTLDDYNEIVIQFSFVVIFGVAFPITALLALASNMVEIYVDASKLCHHMRRPLAQRTSSIPATWMYIMRVVAVLSIITNIVILFQNSTSIRVLLGIDDQTTSSELWIAAFVLEHIIIVLLLWFLLTVPGEPKSITQLKNLSKRIQRAVLVHGKSIPKDDEELQTLGKESVHVASEGGTRRRRKSDSNGYDDGLAALAAQNEGLEREQLAAAAEARLRDGTARGTSRRAARSQAITTVE